MKFLAAFFILIFHSVGLFAASSNTVILTEQGSKNLGLETETAKETDFVTTTFALGRTEAIPENRSALSSRVSGRVIESRLRIGSFVNKGDKLLLVESRQPGNPPPAIWLTAPADGTIIAIHTQLGAPVEPTDQLAELADLRKLYLIIPLPQATAGKIKQDTVAKIHFPIHPDREHTATLLKLPVNLYLESASALRQDTSMREHDGTNLNRSEVVFTLENLDNQLRLGMSAECSIIMETRNRVLSVAKKSIHGSASARHVYIRHPSIPHAFERVNIQTGLTSNDRTEIIDGLFVGDEVVTKGSYSLGFAGSGGGPSLKEAMDAAHGHEHNEDGSEMTPEQKSRSEKASDDHQHASINDREILFMVSTGILAILLAFVSLRRADSKDLHSELS